MTIERLESFGKKAGGVIAYFFRTRAVLKLLAIIAVVVAVVNIINWLPTLQVKASALPERILPPQPDLLGEIPKDAGITLVAENGGKRMYVNPATANISIVDTESGLTWNAFRTEETGEPDEMSLFRFEYISEDNIVSSRNSYAYSQKDGNFVINRIRNGIRLDVQIGNADPTDINAFMPRRMPIDRYEKVFLDGLTEKVEDGVLSESDAGRYKSVLGMIFSKNEEGGYYFNMLRDSPPVSAVRQMLAMVRLLGYTVEDLVLDESPYDLPVEERRPPVGFLIPLDMVLDNGDLVVSVTTENIEVQDDYYTLTRFFMLPYFGSVSATEVASGQIFVPDGSGAVFNLNSFDPSFSGYERPLYWNTVFRDRRGMPPFPEDLEMPVYGMTYADTGGFMAIIEEGDETAFIGARSAAAAAGTGDVYNTVYSGFDAAQFEQIGIAGAGGSFVVSTGMLEMDFVVRYKLFGKPLSYFDMAGEYRQYLISRYDLVPDYSASPRLYLDVIGALNQEGRVLGVRSLQTLSMTSYTELAGILEDLKDIPKTVSYNGIFNRGINNSLPSRAKLVKENGSVKELDNLIGVAADTDTQLFFGLNVSRVFGFSARTEEGGFNYRMHSSSGFNGEPAYFSPYNPATRDNNMAAYGYNQLNPVFLPNTLEGFLSGAKRFDSIYVNDLANDYQASYKRGSMVSPYEGREIANRAFARMKEEKTLALNNPPINAIPYAQWAVNISRESSNYGGFYTSVPFRQLVMNGLVRYTTLDINTSGEELDYFLLQALELGSVPKFNITAKNTDVLKYNLQRGFFSNWYDTHRDLIKGIYGRWAGEFGKIGSAQIVNHETLGDGVFRTTYANGASVTVNYNRFAVETAGGLIGPMSYKIVEGVQ